MEEAADRQRLMAEARAPRQRRPLGTLAELAAVAQAVAATTPGSTVTIASLARELGWADTGRGWDKERLYRWTVDLPAVGEPRGKARLLDRKLVLDRIYEHLTALVQDQRPAVQTPITTAQIGATLTAGGKSNHAVPVCGALRLPPARLLIDPYILGAWLGDGDTAAARIATADAEIVTYLEAAGYVVRKLSGTYAYSIRRCADGVDIPAVLVCAMCEGDFPPSHRRQRYCSRQCLGEAVKSGTHRAAAPRRCAECQVLLARSSTGERCRACWRLATFSGQLKALGVHGNKHIPTAYLRAGLDQRRALLAGLLDTDGTVSPAGQVQFTTTNKDLANGVHDLICSLGLRPAMAQGRARLGDRDCGPNGLSPSRPPPRSSGSLASTCCIKNACAS
ncbi:LAGLIDADG family homing endonuclease, partial [Nonomuraea dietziae]|uniref:LAGLIDADG family homing endonuclease n=1 Tax=Nonomuraea dietziae TaxID=65515 RepID=UPI0031D4D0D7